MLTLYDKNGNAKKLVENKDMEKPISNITDLPKAYSGFVRVDANFYIGSTKIPQYSRGIVVSMSEVDGIAIFVTSDSKLILAFKNSNNWSNPRTL